MHRSLCSLRGTTSTWKGLLRILSPGLLWFPMADRSQSERAAETSNARPSRVPRSLLLVLPCSLALMSCLSSSNNSHKRARCVCVSAASQVVAGILKGWRARRFACPLASYSGWLSRTRTRKASPGPLLPFFRHPPARGALHFWVFSLGERNPEQTAPSETRNGSGNQKGEQNRGRSKPGTKVGTRRGNGHFWGVGGLVVPGTKPTFGPFPLFSRNAEIFGEPPFR